MERQSDKQETHERGTIHGWDSSTSKRGASKTDNRQGASFYSGGRSRRYAVASLLPVTSCLPSGVNARLRMNDRPSTDAIGKAHSRSLLPLSTSQRRTALSSPVVA